jgi:hypothetical protein
MIRTDEESRAASLDNDVKKHAALTPNAQRVGETIADNELKI